MCAGVGKTNHSLRATGAKRLFKYNVTEKIIQESTRHRSTTALWLYDRTSSSQEKAVSKLLSPSDCKFSFQNLPKQCNSSPDKPQPASSFPPKKENQPGKIQPASVLFLPFLTTLKIVPLTLTKASRNVSSSLFRHLNYTSKICVNIREIAVMTERIAIWDLFHTSLILIDLFCAQLLYNYIYFKDETYIMNTWDETNYYLRYALWLYHYIHVII